MPHCAQNSKQVLETPLITLWKYKYFVGNFFEYLKLDLGIKKIHLKSTNIILVTFLLVAIFFFWFLARLKENGKFISIITIKIIFKYIFMYNKMCVMLNVKYDKLFVLKRIVFVIIMIIIV